jgi:hypothetical protein
MHPAWQTPVSRKEIQLPRFQRGFLLIMSVVLIVVVALVLTVMVYFSATSSHATARHLNSKQALFIAGTGLEHGVHALLSPDLGERLDCAAITGDVSMTNIAFGDGRFTVASGVPFYPAAPTTLSLAISASDNTIPVNSLAGYAARGRVLIGGEAIDYSEVETTDDTTCGGAGRAPCLVGAARGRDGTTAAVHAAGSPVGQYQCDLESTGVVPDAANARGRRILNQGVQLQEGWAVGENGAIFRWAAGPAGNPVWVAAASPITEDLNGISMLSYAEGWAVGNVFNPPGPGGDQETILQWNGTAWVLQAAVGAIPNTDLNGIHCVNSDDCWAVGDEVGSEVILRWTGGPSWVRVGPTAAIPNTNLNSVHCAGPDDCWAVGDEVGSEVILRWTGGPGWVRIGPVGGISDTDLNRVFCLATDDCWAVGDNFNPPGAPPTQEIILHWDGLNWTQLAASGAVPDEDLTSVFCVATDDCWAVGDSGTGATQRPLILHWNGTAWATRNSSLNIDRNLSDIFCVTSNDCWAVGRDGAGVAQSPLILHWNGTAWATGNSNLNIDVDLMGVHVIGARQRPRMAWREDYQ